MNEFSLSAINDRISEASEFVQPLRDGLQKKVVGQKTLLDKIIICMLADGHMPVSYTHLTLQTNVAV